MPRMIDLSHPIATGTPPFPGDEPTEIEWAMRIPKDECNVSHISMSAHFGTHLDAPLHFIADGRAVDEVEIDRFFGGACLIDFAPGGELEPGTALTPGMFAEHEEVFVPGARVLFRTGWHRRFGTEAFYRNYPWVTNEAAEWIAGKRIGLLGMDLPSPSPHAAPVHHSLLGPGAEIIVVESLANLNQLPERFVFMALPLRLAGRDGSPVRAAALID